MTNDSRVFLNQMSEKEGRHVIDLLRDAAIRSNYPRTKVSSLIRKMDSGGIHGLESNMLPSSKLLDGAPVTSFLSEQELSVHAETLTVSHLVESYKGHSVLFVYGLFPCFSCAKTIIGAKINRVVVFPVIQYANARARWRAEELRAKELFHMWNVKFAEISLGTHDYPTWQKWDLLNALDIEVYPEPKGRKRKQS